MAERPFMAYLLLRWHGQAAIDGILALYIGYLLMAFLYIGYFYAASYEGVAPQYYQPFIPQERKLKLLLYSYTEH